MTNITRRRLIKQAAIGTGACGALAAAALAGAHFAPATGTTNTTPTETTSADPIVVWIGNPAEGTVVMMRGEQQLVVHDPAFVQRVLSL